MANTPVAYTGGTWGEWLVFTNDIQRLWTAQPTYLISQAVYSLFGVVTLIHASRKGGRWPWFWLATVLHGLYSDNFWHFVLPEYDNFWHSQTPVMFLGARLPLHIILLYPAFIYTSAYAISRLNLPKYSEPFAVGLLVVLIDIPYDIVGVKFVHWTWHDTDPNIYDRHYWVPWNSYYFHATFAASLYFFFIYSRKWWAPKVEKWESASTRVELKSLIAGVLLGMPGGVLLFVPIYHPLHDMYNVHSEVTFFALFAVFATFVFVGLISKREKIKTKLTLIDYVLLGNLAIHYLIYWSFVVFASPETHWSLGLHEPVGPCDQVTKLTTPFGQELKKRKYLCVEDYNEDYFDFHCVSNKKPSHGARWYTICGTPFKNRLEYIVVLSSILVVAVGVFYGIFFKTTATPTSAVKKQKIN